MTVSPMVAVINATPASMQPATEGLWEGFPEAGHWHLLDDRLVSDADAAGGMTPALSRRMLSLIGHAVTGGADAVLLSCSMYGPVAALARQLYEVPVAGSDEQMFAEVLRRSPDRVVVLGSLESATADSVRRLRATLGQGARTRVAGVTAPGAATAASAHDYPALLDALTRAAALHAGTVEMILIGQYSLSPVHGMLADRLGVPVLSPPLMAARALRAHLLSAHLTTNIATNIAANGAGDSGDAAGSAS
ncbi:aspartate/glutamate racemase family protein [Streptosporangium sp. NPDC006013]|uniref:aspartate/glutamate racemase family protein n=1 Tax=Streptosporangium sp. NPDC006013 TaxID=3155596 RepID=UPI0033BF5BFC